MSSKMSNLTKSFLNEIESFKESNDYLDSILNTLEEKNDPSPEEIQLVSDIYQYLEKFHILKENMKRYVIKEHNKNNSGYKLSQLLDNKNKPFEFED